jgi:hypothetical protein
MVLNFIISLIQTISIRLIIFSALVKPTSWSGGFPPLTPGVEGEKPGSNAVAVEPVHGGVR